MSFHLPPFPQERNIECIDTSASDSDHDQDWDDWISDSFVQRPCRSLFEEKYLPSVEDALQYDQEIYEFNLREIFSRLSLDFYARARLINYIRKEKVSPKDVLGFSGEEFFFSSDDYLHPTLEDDPLLQVHTSDWSDSEDDDSQASGQLGRIRVLEEKLAKSEQKIIGYRQLVNAKLNTLNLPDTLHEVSTHPASFQVKDQDSHYFRSYGENDIHAIMIQDKVRTSSYSHFIMTHGHLFCDTVVLDVGCGTGILSLLAARSGAKKVIAVDASDIAFKAKRIVEANNLSETITVIHGKVEEISLPPGIEKVDIIVSEWMGYALLYESMLDSVLCARDRFLRPGGIMAPSQCRMMLAFCDASEILKERVGFWSDVYGFDMSAMATDLYDDSIVDIVHPDAMLSSPCLIKDFILNEVSSDELDFSSPFQLTYKAVKKMKVTAFVLYFDVFFMPTGLPVSPSTEAKVIKEGDVILAELWPVGGKLAPKRRRSTGMDRFPNSTTSFSTGPHSAPTHWKQTIFLLREAFDVCEGTTVFGTFYCRKSYENARELCTEIHYSVQKSPDTPVQDTIVQIYTVR